jgi:CRISPR-associated protein Csb2
MVIIELRFPGGRFHATPWGRHVNEGVPEWPPSPFRLVRALYDTWRRKASEVPADQIEALLGLLASTAPDFALPRAGASHTRSYLRQGSENETDKSLVFDPFVVVMPSDAIRVGWPALVLSEPQEKLLEILVTRLSYFGRTESLVDARLGNDSMTTFWNCRPVDRGGPVASGLVDRQEIVQVACVAAPGTHMRIEIKRGKGMKKPLEWFEALTWGSAEMLDQGLSDPPALRRVSYRRSRDALELPPVPRARGEERRVDSVLLALHGEVLPLVADTVVVAERLRACVMGASRRIGGGDPARVSSFLSGRDATGAPLREHRHAYYLPFDRDGDGRIDHVLVRCSGGLDREDQLAFEGVRTLWQSKGKPVVQVVSVASGIVTDLLETGRVWTSATPFVAPRHHKPKRGEFGAWLENELRRSLTQHGLPLPVHVEPVTSLEIAATKRRLRWGEFVRCRKEDSPRRGFGFRILFAEDVSGPFAVGYGSHFGLGQFVPGRAP